MRSRTFAAIVLMLFGIWLLTACKLLRQDISLLRTRWNPETLNGHALIPGSKITMIFGERKAGVWLSGSAGCNGYYSPVELVDGQIHVPEIEHELQLCIGQEGLMEQEKEYLETLSSVTTYEISDGRLELKNQAGEVVLVFHEDPISVDVALLKKAWLLETLNGRAVIPDSQITATFDEALVLRGYQWKISGNAGCNKYAYLIELEQEPLAFSTRIPDARGYGYAPFIECAGLMEQEEAYIAALLSVASYEVSDDRLELKNQAGEVVLVFRLRE